MSSDAKTISLRHWLDYIETIHAQAVDFDITRPLEVAQKGQFDKFDIPVITVAGTNGKGSTTALISKCLSACGLKVGSYFSPHLQFFNERIIIQGVPVQEHLICHAFAQIEKARGHTTLTYFEFITLAAFAIFKQHDLDVIVLEVGCGGEKDAVNIVHPSLSVITNISKDHTLWLGQELEEIALAKAGIMREQTPAIIGLKAQVPSLLKHAKDLKAKLYLEGQSFGWHDKYKSYWQYNGSYKQVPPTFSSSTSISLSLAALEVLKPILPEVNNFPWHRLGHIVRTAQLPGRFQRMVGRTDLIFDVAHNAAGSIWLANNMSKLPPSVKTIAVWSSFSDKDLPEIVSPLIPWVDTWVIAPMQDKRGASLEDLQSTLVHLGIEDIKQEVSLSKAFKMAEKLSDKHSRILVFGSFGTVGEVLRQLEHNYHATDTFFSMRTQQRPQALEA